MNSFHRRTSAFLTFQKLHLYGGLPLPCDDPSEENVSKWKEAYTREYNRFETENLFTIPLMTIWTTSQCTLQCKYCGNYIPILRCKKIKYRYTFKEFEKNFNKLMNSVDSIFEIVLPGGWGDPIDA